MATPINKRKIELIGGPYDGQTMEVEDARNFVELRRAERDPFSRKAIIAKYVYDRRADSDQFVYLDPGKGTENESMEALYKLIKDGILLSFDTKVEESVFRNQLATRSVRDINIYAKFTVFFDAVCPDGSILKGTATGSDQETVLKKVYLTAMQWQIKI